MKKHRKIVLALVAVLVVVGLTLGAMAVLAQGRSEQAQPVATGATTPEPQAQAPAQPPADRAIVAKGILTPIQHATLSMAAGGIVSEILVNEGQPVAAGQVILRLRNERQQAAVAEAEGAVAAARAQLDTLKAGARTEQIAAGQAALDAANAQLARLQEGGRKGDLAAARANVQAANAALARLYQGADENTKIAAQADLQNAQAALRNAQAAYDKVKDQPDVGMYPQSLQLEQATIAYGAAQARWDELNAAPKADRVAQASAGVKQAQAELDRLIDPATAADIAGAEAAVRQAQAQLDLLKAGARQQEIDAAQAAVTQADAGLRQAQAALNDTELRAPFAGTLAVLNVRQGEQVTPGTPLAEVGDLSGFQVETDDLSELDVVRVHPGQDVRVTFDAVPGLELRGTVDRVQPKGEKKLGDMTYSAIIRLQQLDPRLLWNMTAVTNVP
jgi:HlyD family secretion protein